VEKNGGARSGDEISCMSAPIYLDYQATTPLHPDVLAAMMPYLTEHFGNPHSSTHRAGRTAKAGVDLARENVARALGVAPTEIIFTSGATEANNLALRGVMEVAPKNRNRLVTLATEHSCVLETALDLRARGFAVTILPVRQNGLIDLTLLADALGDDVALVSVMAVNNEIGVVQDIPAIAKMVRACGALFHSDIAQGFGKIELRADDFDLASISGHKIYGPKGIGALYVRNGVKIRPQMMGGGQEFDIRSGTLSPALCVGLGAAAARMKFTQAIMKTLFDVALAALADFPVDWRLNGSAEARYFGNLNICFPGIDGARLLSDARGIMISSGAACASRAGRISHVLAALGMRNEDIRTSVRIGFGEMTTHNDVKTAFDILRETIIIQRQII
jgi:cysteine desulfurase